MCNFADFCCEYMVVNGVLSKWMRPKEKSARVSPCCTFQEQVGLFATMADMAVTRSGAAPVMAPKSVLNCSQPAISSRTCNKLKISLVQVTFIMNFQKAF